MTATIPLRHLDTAHAALSRMIPHARLFNRSKAETWNMRAIRRILDKVYDDTDNFWEAEDGLNSWNANVPLSDTELRWVRDWLITYRKSALYTCCEHHNRILAAQNFLTSIIE